MAEALTIRELAARCELAVERAEHLFELVGSWSGTATNDRARIVLARVTTHAAAHVEWWTQRIPAIDAIDATATADFGVEAALAHWKAAISALASEGPTALGLQGVAELLGRWIDEYADWVSQHDPDLDAPTVRVLELVLADLQRDRDDLVAVAE